jgi:hypothetical protein
MVQKSSDPSDNGRMSADMFRQAAARLEAARSRDGFGPRPGLPPEPEPTALGAIALDDDRARTWLEEHQRADGGFALVADHVVSDSATALAALALPNGRARERAVDHLLTHQAQRFPANPNSPHDPNLRGWGWTPDTFGWVEPTARAVLALQLLRPTAGRAIADGLAVLADRECVGGGWNYGNRSVMGVDLPPYAETTAIALIGLQGADPDLYQRGVDTLDRLWRDERRGGLSLSMSLAAFSLVRGPAHPSIPGIEAALDAELERTGLLDDVVALAWAAIASGPGLDQLRWPRP